MKRCSPPNRPIIINFEDFSTNNYRKIWVDKQQQRVENMLIHVEQLKNIEEHNWGFEFLPNDLFMNESNWTEMILFHKLNSSKLSTSFSMGC